MKKFEMPEEIKSNFIKETMTREPKNVLNHYKEKTAFRERAYTYNEHTFYQGNLKK